MNLLIAPDSFKGSLSAIEVCESIESGWLSSMPETSCISQPMADGGEGTLEILAYALGGKIINTPVSDALGQPCIASWAWVSDQSLAIIELAQASGLQQLPLDKRSAVNSSTDGVGELIAQALDHGAKKIIVTLGGSATNDAGSGILSALGAKFLDDSGNVLAPGGLALEKLASIDLEAFDKRLLDVEFQVACDVDNPLCGENGASAVFGPQKGASPTEVLELDQALGHYARVCEQQLAYDLQSIVGGGAAGGVAASLATFLGASLISGADMVLACTGLEEQIQQADLIITGEGAVDSQTLQGKLPWKVAIAAAKYNKPVIIVAGGLGKGYESIYQLGNVAAITSIMPAPMSLENALTQGATNLQSTARTLSRFWSSSISNNK